MNQPDRVALLPVRVTPRAGRDGIDGVIDGKLRVHVRASPVDGAANAAVERLIAGALDVPRSSVRIVRGVTARHKLLALDGLTQDELITRWPDLVDEPDLGG